MRRVDQRTHPWSGHLRPGGVRVSGHHQLGHLVEGDSTVAAGVSACGYSVAPQPHRGTPPAFVRPNLKQNCVCGGLELGESRQACRSRRRNVVQLRHDGRLHVPIDGDLPLDQANEAHQRILRQQVLGKLLRNPNR